MRCALAYFRVATTSFGACVLLACDADPGRENPPEPTSAAVEVTVKQPAFCDRGQDRNTAIDALFCAEPAPAIASLRDLQAALQLVPFALAADGGGRSVNEVVMLAHSTSLPGQLVSPINPRAFILGRDTMLAYVRGAQEVELVSRARDGSDELTFYLLRYQQACNQSEDGCSNVELYTPATERDWTELRVSDDSELENTPFDCRSCHARGGERATLLMREVDGPWTHFFDSLNPAEGGNSEPEVRGYDLLQDYIAAKGDERYAEIDVTRLKQSTAQALEIVVGLDQPLYFDSLAIERERWPSGPDGYDDEPRHSETWQASYDAWKRGEQLALPHYDPRPTSPDKQQQLTAAYTRFREDGATELPDLADIFPDDPTLRAEIGLEVERDASPVDALIQACGPCHNSVLNQNISRAAFNIDLSRMGDDELDSAIERIELPRTAAGAMPPLRARVLPEETRARLVAYLRGAARSAEQDPQLQHAAEMGMRGGSRPSRR